MSAASLASGVDAPSRLTITRPLDAMLREVAERYPILGWATPKNAASEQARLLAAWRAGNQASPAWEPPGVDRRALAHSRRAIERARAALTDVGDRWIALYVDRLAECALDLEVIDASFTRAITDASRRRFGSDERDERAADRLAAQWIATPLPAATDETIATDDERDARSLVSQMRRAISAQRLGVRVLVRDRIGALAAAGDGVVIVARGRRTTAREVARVVLHEIEGHVLPRERGRATTQELPGICTLGSAGASEDEEGRAICLEERAGLLEPKRRRSLAARHVAARIVERGGSYVDVVRHLRGAGLADDEALEVASRVQRGAYREGAAVVGGVARERVYLSAYVRVSAATEGGRTLDSLGDARLSLAARARLGS